MLRETAATKVCVIKRKGSLYEPGKRSGAWMKIKRPHGTLDVVITAAEQGSGRRAIYLSDYTFAVREGDRYLNVGKAYSGLTDAGGARTHANAASSHDRTFR